MKLVGRLLLIFMLKLCSTRIRDLCLCRLLLILLLFVILIRFRLMFGVRVLRFLIILVLVSRCRKGLRRKVVLFVCLEELTDDARAHCSLLVSDAFLHVPGSRWWLLYMLLIDLFL